MWGEESTYRPELARERAAHRKTCEERDKLRLQVAALEARLNTPEFVSFRDAVVLEAAHQVERWGTEHDAGKTDAEWLWLIGYLIGKALHNPGVTPDNATEKKLHRIIAAAAACANWHAQVIGKSNMRPGIEPPTGEKRDA